MDKIKNYFDDFILHARVMPVVVLLIPIMAIGIFKGIIQDNWLESSYLLAISIAFLTVTSKVARNLGKACENEIYKQLRGMPTTIVLRFSDNTFDNITKQRYHNILNKFEGLALPLDKSNETLDDDQQYSSAANILRNYANSNRDTEPRVYQELKEYNFWRNLFGAKRIALFGYLIILIREILLIGKFSFKQAFLHPYPDYISLIIIVFCIAFIMLFVNKKVVTQKGFDYAKTLIEVCERIPVDGHNIP